MIYFRIVLLACLQILTLVGAAHSQSEPSEQRFRLRSDAVILDVVVRDKKGQLIRDLDVDDFRVFENGKEQQIHSVRLVDGTVPGEAREAPLPNTLSSAPVSALSQIHLVSLVYDRLDNENRRYARQASEDLLEMGLPADTYIAVFSIDQGLRPVIPFTNDLELVRKGMELATSGRFEAIKAQAQQLHEELMEASAEVMLASGVAPAAGVRAPSGDASSEAVGPATVAAGNADISTPVTNSPGAPSAAGGGGRTVQQGLLINILERAGSTEGEFQSHAVLDGLDALVSAQRELPGRKTALYFSSGMYVPEKLVYRFRNLISASNLSNVSIYTIDTRGLTSQSQSRHGMQELNRAAGLNQAQVGSGVGAVTAEEVRSLETAENSIRMNVQETLQDLSNSTGGFLTANTNDPSEAMERLVGDLQRYYEIVYFPEVDYNDAGYRKISIEVNRDSVTVQSRDGYFPVPVEAGGPVMAYEMPLLASLDLATPPRDLPLRSQTFHFSSKSARVEEVLVARVPFESLEMEVDSSTQSYSGHVSFLALIKEIDGKVVSKLSRDFVLEGTVEELEAMKERDLVFLRRFEVPPGRYYIELAVHDHFARKSATKRQVLVAQGQEGLAMSSLLVIGGLEPLSELEAMLETPLKHSGHRIIPHVGSEIDLAQEPEINFYCLVYPGSEESETELTVAVFREGEALFKGNPELSLEAGKLAGLFAIPTSELGPGTYELRAWVQQGEEITSESTFFTLKR